MKKLRFFALLFAVVLALSVFSGCEKKGGSQKEETVKSLDGLKGEKVAVLSGSVFDKIAEREIEGCQVQYTNSNPDLGVMLDTDKVKAYITDEPTARLIFNNYPNQMILEKISDDSYGFFFKKNDEKGSLLCSQMNEYLSKIRKNGTMKQIDDIWFGDDAEKQIVDTEGLTGENGTLKMALTTTIGMPFTYMKDNKLVGYDVDIAVRFCREYGYGIEFVDGAFATMLSEVSTGKCDFGASCVTITEERKESVLFSDPDYDGSTVVVIKDYDKYVEKRTIKDFDGKKIAVLTGSVFDSVAFEYIKDCAVDFFNSYPDMAASVISGKNDGFIIEALASIDMLENQPQLTKIATLREDDYGLIFRKNSEKGTKLCLQMNEFLSGLKADGTLEKIKTNWENSSECEMPDISNMTGENGKLIFAMSSNMGAPFSFLRNGEYVGYEVELAYRFCMKYGYSIEIIDSDFNGILSNVESGKADFGAGSISITKERAEKMLFSDPDYTSGCILIAKKLSDGSENNGIFDSIIQSFDKTFIREKRWELFVSGLLTTLLITVSSIVAGTFIGYLIYLGCRSGGKLPNAIVDVLMHIFEKTPVVVILMIFYYIFFGNSKLAPMWVSMICFTLIFAANVTKLIQAGVDTVDKGQIEAAYALGYTDRQTFTRIIFPQALTHIIPGFTSAVVTLVKDTAIVGYIAVQDLTKVSDIVRSRTFEPFFPIIVSAILYFLFALLLITVIGKLGKYYENRHKSTAGLLKGVKTK